MTNRCLTYLLFDYCHQGDTMVPLLRLSIYRTQLPMFLVLHCSSCYSLLGRIKIRKRCTTSNMTGNTRPLGLGFEDTLASTL